MNLIQNISIKSCSVTSKEYADIIMRDQKAAKDYLINLSDNWTIPKALTDKVDEVGAMRPFYGDTTVFELSDIQIARIEALIDQINNLETFWAQPLDPKQLHLTLHDLSNSPIEGAVISSMESNQKKVRDIFKKLSLYLTQYPEYRFVKLRSTEVFPSMNIALLLGFIPATDRDARVFLNLYNLFEDVVYLDYWPRPHVTLSYFTPSEFEVEERKQLFDLCEKLQKNPVELEFDILKLAYQHFFDMNSYKTIMRVGDIS